MIHEIYPKKLNIAHHIKTPKAEDTVMFFRGGEILAHVEDGLISYPVCAEVDSDNVEYIYLFEIDGTEFYAGLSQKAIELDGYDYMRVNLAMRCAPRHLAFSASCAYHLYCWYRDNRFCGRCGEKFKYSEKERCLTCSCGNVQYPKICPGIIVAVTSGDRILLTKYANRGAVTYALIAGFCEFGEDLETTVKREVMEEVGVKIKNLKYYKSQPWGLSSTLLMGFTAELDGDDSITLDREELAEGVWFKREDIPLTNDGISLTRELIEKFKNGEI